jgi:proline racemase
MPAGPIDIVAECTDGKCVSVTLRNVPAFVFALDAVVEVPGIASPISVDIAYGGMIYAIVDAASLGFEIVPAEARDLAVLGEQIRAAVREQHPVTHPELPDIKNVSIVQFAGPLTLGATRARARNTCIVSPGRSDRSPTGTGTTARMAVLHARGVLSVGGGLTHSSIIGSEFHGTIVGETTVGPFPAIEATIQGRAWITGLHHYFVDADDPWPSGYVLSDTWGTSTAVTQQ